MHAFSVTLMLTLFIRQCCPPPPPHTHPMALTVVQAQAAAKAPENVQTMLRCWVDRAVADTGRMHQQAYGNGNGSKSNTVPQPYVTLGCAAQPHQ